MQFYTKFCITFYITLTETTPVTLNRQNIFFFNFSSHEHWIKTSLMGWRIPVWKKWLFYLSLCLLCRFVSFLHIHIRTCDFLLGFYNIAYFAIPHNLPLAFRAERILLTRTTASVFCHAIIAVSDFLEFSCTLSYFSVSFWFLAFPCC